MEEELKRADPRDEAREYLRKHNIDRLFQELGSAIVFERPEDIDSFLISKLKEIKEKRGTEEQSSIFNEQDLETLFNMHDTGKQGTIDQSQCQAALRVLGVSEPIVQEITSTEASVSKELFIKLCKKGLVLSRDTAPQEAKESKC